MLTIFVFIFSKGYLIGQTWSGTEYSCEEFFFELTRVAITGVSQIDGMEKYIPLTKQGASLLLLPVWNRESLSFDYFYEILYPQKKGVIQSSFLYEDCVSSLDIFYNRIDSIILSWNVNSTLDYSADDDILALLDNKDGQAKVDEEEVEITNVDKNGSLRKYSFLSEQISVSQFNDFNVLTDASDEKVKRLFFDSEWNLVKKEVFNNPSFSSRLELKSTTDYFYNDNTLLNSIEENKTLNKRIEIEYSPARKPVLVESFHYEEVERTAKEKEEEKPIEYKSVKDYKKIWTYDEQNRIIKLEDTSYSASQKDSVQTKDFTKVYEYKYTEKSSMPDSFYYENEKLRVKTIYSGEKEYTETFYFDGDFSVETEYEDGFKMSEVIYNAGQILRSRSFEKDF